jgi:glycine cleavage system H protein
MQPSEDGAGGAAMEFPVELCYSEEHTWVRDEEGKGYIGITDYAQDQLGEIIFVGLPAVGDKVERMEVFGDVESIKAVNDLYAPVSGKAVEVNEMLEEAPETINSDPYGDGWIIAIAMDDENELKDLLSAEAYKEMIEER